MKTNTPLPGSIVHGLQLVLKEGTLLHPFTGTLSAFLSMTSWNPNVKLGEWAGVTPGSSTENWRIQSLRGKQDPQPPQVRAGSTHRLPAPPPGQMMISGPELAQALVFGVCETSAYTVYGWHQGSSTALSWKTSPTNHSFFLGLNTVPNSFPRVHQSKRCTKPVTADGLDQAKDSFANLGVSQCPGDGLVATFA